MEYNIEQHRFHIADPSFDTSGKDCFICLVRSLMWDILQLEQQRDGLGRHTNVSGEMESLMSKHEALFELFK